MARHLMRLRSIPPSSRRLRRESRDLGTGIRSDPTKRPRIGRFLTSSRRFEITQVIPQAKKCKLFRLRNDGCSFFLCNNKTRGTSSRCSRQRARDLRTGSCSISYKTPYPEISRKLKLASK